MPYRATTTSNRPNKDRVLAHSCCCGTDLVRSRTCELLHCACAPACGHVMWRTCVVVYFARGSYIQTKQRSSARAPPLAVRSHSRDRCEDVGVLTKLDYRVHHVCCTTVAFTFHDPVACASAPVHCLRAKGAFQIIHLAAHVARVPIDEPFFVQKRDNLSAQALVCVLLFGSSRSSVKTDDSYC